MSGPSKRGGLANSTALHLILILVLGFLVYSNTFSAPFAFDDTMVVQQNPLTRDVGNIPSIMAGKRGEFASRPLMLATFALNYRFGGLNTRGYHAVNLALHLLNAALLYFLVLLTGRHLKYPDEESGLAAVFAALIFAVHPLQTEGVTYIVSRSMLFSTTFYLLGTALYLKAVTGERNRGMYVAALFAASLLGMGSRENFATFPLMLVVYDLLFISKLNARETARHWWALLPAFLSLAYLVHLVTSNTYDRTVDYEGEGIPAFKYAITQFKVHWTYLRLFALPIGQSVDYDYPTSARLLEPKTVIAAVGYAGLWAVGLVSAKRRPVAAFPIIWFLLILTPISFGVTLLNLRLGDVLLEHRVYLPDAGLCALAGAGAVYLSRRLGPDGRTAAMAMLVLIAISLMPLTVSRNRVWRTDISLWEDVIAKAPDKARGYNNLAMSYSGRGETEVALRYFELAVRKDPDFPLAHYNMGSVLGRTGRLEEAEEHLLKAVTLMPSYGHAHNNLGNVYLLKGDLQKAQEQFKLAVYYRPENYEAHRNLALVYEKMGEHDMAVKQMGIAESLRSRQGAR